jgi:hypothetical protein
VSCKMGVASVWVREGQVYVLFLATSLILAFRFVTLISKLSGSTARRSEWARVHCSQPKAGTRCEGTGC